MTSYGPTPPQSWWRRHRKALTIVGSIGAFLAVPRIVDAARVVPDNGRGEFMGACLDEGSSRAVCGCVYEELDDRWGSAYAWPDPDSAEGERAINAAVRHCLGGGR